MLVGDDYPRFVFNLVVPAARPVRADYAVIEFLRVLRERHRPHDAEVYRKRIEPVFRRLVRPEADVQPTRVGAVGRRRIGNVDVACHAHLLPDRNRLERLPAVGDKEVERGELQAARKEIAPRARIRKLQAVRVVAVGKIDVVFDAEGYRLRILRGGGFGYGNVRSESGCGRKQNN